jgi:lambda repressor-like predicted transcriptional regulator
MTPRSDVIARLFCEGKSIAQLAFRYLVLPDVIEECLRRRLERLLAKKRRSKR